jgi:hypothetical protein
MLRRIGHATLRRDTQVDGSGPNRMSAAAPRKTRTKSDNQIANITSAIFSSIDRFRQNVENERLMIGTFS